MNDEDSLRHFDGHEMVRTRSTTGEMRDKMNALLIRLLLIVRWILSYDAAHTRYLIDCAMVDDLFTERLDALREMYAEDRARVARIDQLIDRLSLRDREVAL